MNLTHDKEFQRQLLNHPAYRHQGVDPLWRIIAVMGWLTVLALMLALSARSQTLVVGLNGKRASSPVSVEAKTSPSGLANATAEMKPLLWSNDDRSLSPHPILILLNAPARVCGTGVIQTGAGRNF